MNRGNEVIIMLSSEQSVDTKGLDITYIVGP